ncbi:DUF4179 domain-containing protein [Paenibacillus koleovorans]|uniref:DUF4179 domain-containing protein n=1 Tax=Paenibacillus koleovorans TaxID=121608 RepID=UPI000FD8CE6E|nr:DUF4179 domain-containing protein [Paenibacillus koleovorans]
MNEAIERSILRNAERQLDPIPDFDSMWARIQDRLLLPVAGDKRISKKPYLIAATAASLLLSVPAMASPQLWDWMKQMQRSGITAAWDAGYGQSVERKAEANGVTLTVHQALADSNRIALTFSLLTEAVKSESGIRTAMFDRLSLTDENEQLLATGAGATWDEHDRRLKGYVEGNRLPEGERSQLTLTAENLILLREALKPLPLNARTDSGAPLIATDLSQELRSLKVESMHQEQNRLTVEYTVSMTDSKWSSLNPSLRLISSGQPIAASFANVLPSDNPLELKRKDIFLLDDPRVQDADFALQYLEPVRSYIGQWNIPFELNMKQANQTSITRQLQGDIPVAGGMHQLDKLVVSPSQIRVTTKAYPFDPQWKELITYRKLGLRVGEETITGSLFGESAGVSFRFETHPDGEISKKPMHLIMSDASIQKRAGSQYQVTLIQPQAARKTVSAKLDRFTINYTYYKQGSDLVVETSSDDPAFGGIVRLFLPQDGRDLLADEKFSGDPFHRTNGTRTEIFRKIKDGDVVLYPFTYVVLEPERKQVIPLQ